MVCDGSGLNTIMRELNLCYTAFRDGSEPVLPPLPIQFRDFAVWQEARLSGERLETLRRYWSAKVEGASPLEMPSDGEEVPDITAGRAIMRLDQDLTRRLHTRCAREKLLFSRC